MKGRHEILVKDARVQYKFAIERNITILRGDSATGKTTLIEMIGAFQRNGDQSGVALKADKPCVVLYEQNWELVLGTIHDSIVFIDEGSPFISSHDFARAIRGSDNYYVIATRHSLYDLPYSIKEIYGIRNTTRKRYQGTKRLYAEFFPLIDYETGSSRNPDLVVVEDTNAGYEFFQHYFARFHIRCISAQGKSKIIKALIEEEYNTALVIADGAAFGPVIERLLGLRQVKDFSIFLPESFEWLVMRSDVLNDNEIRTILDAPSEHIASETYFSWEQFFTEMLIDRSRGTYLAYVKNRLNKTT
ncbi:MAG: translation initiation factor 2 [Oscillospiraceae bacterium]|nr:translation initiation factor 2 [Oscillospiraceae bacterium]